MFRISSDSLSYHIEQKLSNSRVPLVLKFTPSTWHNEIYQSLIALRISQIIAFFSDC